MSTYFPCTTARFLLISMSYQFYLNHFFDSIFNFSPKIQIQNAFIDNYYHVSHFIQRVRAVVHDFIRILNDSFSHLQHLGIKKDKLYFKLTFSLITLLKYKHQPCRTLRHMRRSHRAADSYHHISPDDSSSEILVIARTQWNPYFSIFDFYILDNSCLKIF